MQNQLRGNKDLIPREGDTTGAQLSAKFRTANKKRRRSELNETSVADMPIPARLDESVINISSDDEAPTITSDVIDLTEPEVNQPSLSESTKMETAKRDIMHNAPSIKIPRLKCTEALHDSLVTSGERKEAPFGNPPMNVVESRNFLDKTDPPHRRRGLRSGKVRKRLRKDRKTLLDARNEISVHENAHPSRLGLRPRKSLKSVIVNHPIDGTDNLPEVNALNVQGENESSCLSTVIEFAESSDEDWEDALSEGISNSNINPTSPSVNNFQYEDVSIVRQKLDIESESRPIFSGAIRKNKTLEKLSNLGKYFSNNLVSWVKKAKGDSESESRPTSPKQTVVESRDEGVTPIKISPLAEGGTPESTRTFKIAGNSPIFLFQKDTLIPTISTDEKIANWKNTRSESSEHNVDHPEWEERTEEITESKWLLTFSMGMDLVPTGLVTDFLTEEEITLGAPEQVDLGSAFVIKNKNLIDIALLIIKYECDDDIELDAIPLAFSDLALILNKPTMLISIPQLGIGNGALDWPLVGDTVKQAADEAGLKVRVHMHPEFPVIDIKAITARRFTIQPTKIYESSDAIVLDMSTDMMAGNFGVRAAMRRAHDNFGEYDLRIFKKGEVLYIKPSEFWERHTFYVFCRHQYSQPFDMKAYETGLDKVISLCELKKIIDLITLMPNYNLETERPGEIRKIMREAVAGSKVSLTLAVGSQD